MIRTDSPSKPILLKNKTKCSSKASSPVKSPLRKRPKRRREEVDADEDVVEVVGGVAAKTKAEIWQAFGLSPKSAASSQIYISDDEEEEQQHNRTAAPVPKSTSSGSKPTGPTATPEYYDALKKKYVRVLPGADGVVVGKFTAGANGFAKVEWPDEPGQLRQTEVANLVL